ncbi:unnamed protein product [Effrenium voratum]|nr:unnamed protein product [Effrenium voratum]
MRFVDIYARLSVIPEQQVALNNNYFPQWLGPTFIGAYIALFAESVLEGTTSMGVFLAIISVISDMTNDFEGIFIELMSINTRIDSLKVLTHFFNMESELPILRELNLRNRARTKEDRSAVLKMPEPPPETGLLRTTDLIEMRIENVSFNYRPNQKLLENVGLLHVPLGKIEPWNTFLRLIASRLLPEKGEIFVPTHLIERAFAGVRGKGRSPTAASIINEAFGNVTEDGGYLLGNIKADATWEECTRIDWNEVAKFDDEEGKLSPYSVERMLKELHLQACLDGESDWAKDDTCKAVKAALEVSTELSHDPFEPLFANFSVVAWGKYPSWVKDTVVDLDYSKPMPVKAKVKDPKGVIGYAICDLLRVILTQSADQMSTGTCSYVASLAALSHKAPAKLIKLAVRLFWTGMITPKVGKACDGIYHQQPGLVPFKSGYGWIPSFYQNGGSASCAGSAMDCATSQGRPQQNAALTFSWTQYLISTWMKENWGYCQKDGVRSGLTYPGQDDYDAAMATRNQGGWYNSMFWECANFIDPEGGSCKLLVNPNTCVLGKFEVCEKKWSLEPAFEVQSEVWEPLVVKYRTEAWMQGAVSYSEQEKYVIPKLHEAFAEKPLLRDYLEFLQSLANKTGESVFEINEVSGPPFPSFTEELLKQTCEAYTNLLVIDATVLQVAFSNPGIIQQARDQDLPLFGNFGLPSVSYGCNHAVYLQSCDFKKDLFKIWTWGTTVTLSKRMLLGWPAAQRGYPTRAGASWTWNTGAICASVTADQITVD